MGELLAPLEVVGVLILLFAVVIGGFVARRHVLFRRGATFDCSLRRSPARRPGGWMLGVARYEEDRLEWFRIFTIDPRPGKVMRRSRLGLLEWRPPAGVEIDAIMPDSVVVRCTYGPEILEMAMTKSDYTGFSTWLESAPPGIAPFTS